MGVGSSRALHLGRGLGAVLVAVAVATPLVPDAAAARTRSFCGGFVVRECGRDLQPQCTSGAACDRGFHSYTGAPFPIRIDCPFPFADGVVRGGCYRDVPSCDDCGGDGQLECAQETAQYCRPGCDPGHAVIPDRLQPHTCHRLRTIGEGCSPFNPCVETLGCELCPLAECNAPLQCVPNANNGPITQQQCLQMHSDDLRASAANLGRATTYGGGTLLSAVYSRSVEVGAVYGPDGRFGCYRTICEGGESNVGGSYFGTVGFYESYANVAGSSIASVESGSFGVVGVSTAQIYSGPLIGTAHYFSIGSSVLPVSAGVYQCETTVDTVIGTPPQTPSPTPTVEPTGTPAGPVCGGDCNASGHVTVDNLVLAVSIALGSQGVERCRSLDADGDGRVEIADVVRAVGYALDGCPTIRSSLRRHGVAD